MVLFDFPREILQVEPCRTFAEWRVGVDTFYENLDVFAQEQELRDLITVSYGLACLPPDPNEAIEHLERVVRSGMPFKAYQPGSVWSRADRSGHHGSRMTTPTSRNSASVRSFTA